MTAFARKVLTELPAPTNDRRLEQLLRSCRTSRTPRTRPAARSTSRSTRRCRPSAASAGATSTSSTTRRSRCRRAAPATPHDLRRATSSSRSASTYTPTSTSLLEVRFGWSTHRRRARTRRRWARAPARSTRTASPACPTDPRVAGGLPTQLITGFSDLGRQATNPQWQYPTVYNPKVNYTLADGPPLAEERLRVPAHPDRSAGRQSALWPRHLRRAVLAGRSASPPPTTCTTSPTSCSALRIDLRAEQHLHRRTSRQNMHFAYLQDDWRVNDRPDAQPRPALRIRDAVGREGQHPVELRSGDADDGAGAGRLAAGPLDARSPIATTSARGSASPRR